MKKLLLFLLLLAGMSHAQTTVAPFITPYQQFFDNSGKPLAGGKVCTYTSQTSSQLATYSDNGSTLNSNPVILDSAGRAKIYLTIAAYKIVVAASTADSTCSPAITTIDPVSWATISTTVASLISNGTLQVIPSTAATSGANQSGPNLQDCGNAWNGSSSIADCWSFSDVLGTGSNPTSTLTLTHSGSSGTATFSIPSAAVSLGSTLSVTGATTLSTLTVTGTSTLGLLLRKIAGRTCYADQYAGADAGAKMIAAEADSSCSIVDATGFTGAQSGTSTVTANVPLILGAYTYTSSANPAISVGTQSALSGQGMLATIIASSSNTADVIKVPSTSIRWSIHDLQITQPSTRSAGAALRVSGGNGSISNVYLPIFFDGMFFDTAVTSGANMITHFYMGNATDTGTPHCGIRNGGVSSGTVSSNQFENGIILETANYSDAMVCIQDGSDTIMFTNFQAVWDVSHAGTVAFHTEVVNAGIEPYDIKCTNCVFEAGASANVMNFDKIRAFECTNCTASGGLDGVALNGGVASGGGEWTWIGGKISNNHHHGLDILTGGIGQITVIGTRFADNGQSTNNTYDDIFNTGAGNVQLIGLEFNTVNSVLPTNLPKWNIEIGAGVCGNYTIVGNNYAQAGVSGTISNGCTSSTGLSLDANSGALNIIGGGILRTPKNVARVTSDFTSANSAALQAITGLSFSLPAVAINYAFHCSVIFSQATNVAGDQFGVASLTTAPTAVSVNSFVAQNITAGTTLNGNLLGLSTTTPTAFVTFQPAITGALGATWDGVIEASGSGASTLQFYVLNGTAADVIVVKKDSFCTLAAQ